MKTKTYDDLKELLEDLEQDRLTADSAVKEWQSAASNDSFYVRWVPDAEVLVYGELCSPLAWYDKQPQPLSDELLSEREYEEALWQQPHMKNNRFGKHYSVLCPKGEFGTVHVSTFLALINREQFDFMRRCKWPVDISDLRRNLKLFGEMH